MFEVQILVPLTDNEAREFTPEHHSQFEEAILERFGGLSLLPNTITGKWKDVDKIYSDQLRVYVVALPSIRQGNLIESWLKSRRRIIGRKRSTFDTSVRPRFFESQKIRVGA